MRSSASMCTVSTIVLRERPVSEVHPRLARELRGVNSADREDSNVNIDRLNYHPGIQKMCKQLEHAEFNSLRSSSRHGMDLVARIVIPKHRELSHYTGTEHAATYNPIVNRSKCHPAEYTLWLGTRVLREPAVLDLELYLNPDHRYTPQLRGGMPGRRPPTDDIGFPKQVGHGSTRNESKHPMRTRSSISTGMNSSTVQRGTLDPAVIPRLVYMFGEVVGEDCEDVRVSIEQFNSHPGIQKKCEHLELAGSKYLQISSLHGTGIAAKIDIPQNTELCYYIGIVYAVACNPVGNHSIEVASSGRTTLCVNATSVPKNLPLGCSMHLANHGCNPNCRVTPYEPDGWDNDLVLLVLVAMRDIVGGEAITFQYKGSMWQARSELPLLAPKGFRLIQCGCDQPCPNGLARLDWIDSGHVTSPIEAEEWYRGRKLSLSTPTTVSALNTRSPINTEQNFSCKSLHTAAPDGVNDLSQSSTSGIKESVSQSQNRRTLHLSTEHVLQHGPWPIAAKVVGDRREDEETVNSNGEARSQAS